MLGNPSLETLHEQVTLTRAEEAKAFRRALHFRVVGTPGEALDAMRDVDSLQSRITRLEREIKRRRAL